MLIFVREDDSGVFIMNYEIKKYEGGFNTLQRSPL